MNEYDKETIAKPFSSWLDAGVLLAILTATGYLVAYSYQKAYLSYFGINDLFISEITIVNIVISTLTVGTSLILAIILYNQLFNLSHQEPFNSSPFAKTVIKSLAPLFIVSTFLFAFREQWIVFVCVLLGVIFYYYIYPILRFPKEKNYKNKLSNQIKDNEENGINTERLILKWNNVPSFKYIMLMLMLLLINSISELYGSMEATNAEDFLIFEYNNETYLVIDNVGSDFISAPINLSSNTIENEFIVVEQQSTLENQITFENIHINGGVKTKNNY